MLGGLFKRNSANLEKRFDTGKNWFQTLTGPVDIVVEKDTNKKFGLKRIDLEKVTKIRSRYESLDYPPETKIAESVVHPAVLKVIETGVVKRGGPFVLMEYFEGPTLAKVVATCRRELRGKQFGLMRQLADAIIAVHDAGYVHRNLSSSSIVVSPDLRTLKVGNFSLAFPNKPEFCKVRNRVGTPLYMAPEIIRRREADQRVDVFAYGILAYEIICLRHPWGVTENNSKTALTFDSEPPVHIRTVVPRVSKMMGDAIMRCLEVDAEKRFPNIKSAVAAMGLR